MIFPAQISPLLNYYYIFWSFLEIVKNLTLILKLYIFQGFKFWEILVWRLLSIYRTTQKVEGNSKNFLCNGLMPNLWVLCFCDKKWRLQSKLTIKHALIIFDGHNQCFTNFLLWKILFKLKLFQETLHD